MEHYGSDMESVWAYEVASGWRGWGGTNTHKHTLTHIYSTQQRSQLCSDQEHFLQITELTSDSGRAGEHSTLHMRRIIKRKNLIAIL